jgi:transcription antitermination factor NusG
MAWYVLRSQTRQERLAVTALTERGVMAYCPVEIRKLQIPGRPKSQKTLVLFPGYLFAVLPDDAAIDVVRSIHAIRDIMCNGDGEPRPARTSAIRGLFLAEAFHLFDETWEPPKVKIGGYSHAYKPGDRVRIKKGVLEGFAGEVVKAKNTAKLMIIAMVFGRPQEFEVDARDVETPQPKQG